MKTPEWLDPRPALRKCRNASPSAVRSAIAAKHPGINEFAAMLSPAAEPFLDEMASRAKGLTQKYFGKTISLYAPLYLSNHCSSGCAYCGFASDRKQPRRRLDGKEIRAELSALHRMGLDDILLLTGERTPEAGFTYLLNAVETAAKLFHNVSVESFAMTDRQYAELFKAGCTGITLYQETYDAAGYRRLHRWGRKRDYRFRLEAPERALAAGMRTFGIGTLFGLGDPVYDAICLFQHAKHLQKKFWQAGISVSFPRICDETGHFKPVFTVSGSTLARIIFAFRICFPEITLVLSTRESRDFRDHIAGIGINRMSVASRTTVGGYSPCPDTDNGQFHVNDTRGVKAFCRALKSNGLMPVFKNWDRAFQQA